MMKTIVLFSRSDLVYLYGKLDKYLSPKMNVIHLAYSNIEYNILAEEYKITNIYNFSNSIKDLYLTESLDIELCKTIDSLIIEQSDGRFSLNQSIQSDRTYIHLSYRETLIMSQVYFKFWSDFIAKHNVKYLIHEPTALSFLHIAAVICKKIKAHYLSQTHIWGEDEKYTWMFTEGDNGHPIELYKHFINKKRLSTEEVSRVEKFIESFRQGKEVLFPEMKKNENKKNFFELLISILKCCYRSFKHKLLRKIEFESYRHVDKFLSVRDLSLIEDIHKQIDLYYSVKYDNNNSSIHYFYYPLHLEPESAVLYWGDGIYKNQVKLIENIASQLPPNYYLYVKDHPHGGNYRDHQDYKKIQQIPNVKLLNPNESGIEVIKGSQGVITINGTSGFEAILLNKPVFVFGHSYYDLSDRVQKIYHIRDFRKILYESIEQTFNDDENLYFFIHSYLASSHEGFVNYFSSRAKSYKIDEDKNAQVIVKELISSFVALDSQ